jgi:hypothetical protein
VYGLVSRDRIQRAVKRLETMVSGNSILNESMVLFNDVVGVLRDDIGNVNPVRHWTSIPCW